MSSFRRISNHETRLEMSMSEISDNLKQVFLINDKSHGAIRSRCDWIRYRVIKLTSPARAVATYCDVYVCVCVCVCLSVRLFLCPTAYPRSHTRDLYHFLCVLPMSVALSSSGTLTVGRIACRREGPAKCNLRLPLLQI